MRLPAACRSASSASSRSPGRCAADPCLLLLDEPAAGLRYLEKQALADLLAPPAREGIGILLVEHDMDFVMGLADRVVVMEFGRKLAAGLPEEIQRESGGGRSLSRGWSRMSELRIGEGETNRHSRGA
jgi:energy-coupling factor transporter ATP-binding protein EcfA2